MLAHMEWTGAIGWSELLQSPRVLIVSEAGAGKTHECRAEHAERWEAGEPAFFFELAELSRNKPDDLLDAEEQERFDAWRTSQSDIATFFLDSIDELKLTLGSFEVALKRLHRSIAGQLGRVRIVITTRPIPIDRALIQKIFPVPEMGEVAAGEDTFADIATNRHRNEKKDNAEPPEWRYVALMPLSNDQIREMAAFQGVSDAEALLEDIRKRNAEDFARRPQDLIELCTDWRDHRRVRTHREQIQHNIEIKLKPRADLKEKAQLTEEKALEGASRLALAALLIRKLNFRHSAEADKGGEASTALDPATILPDWAPDERATLLERALFGFASYGRVRFHHRSVVEYLAAQRLGSLLGRGMSIKAVKRLLFTQTPQGIKVVKPSMRPVGAWLALSRPSIFGEIRDREPDVLLNHADPESLTPELRIAALRAYVERYGQGSWRGMHVPRMQIHRFASNDLGPEVLSLWCSGIENPEVRELLLELLAAVPVPAGADIAFSVVMRSDAEIDERVDAFDVLIKLNDPRIDTVTLCMATDPGAWPDKLLKSLVPRLFPKHIAVDRLCCILSRITQSHGSVDWLNYLWAPSIATMDIAPDYLDSLREGLTALVIDGVKWHQELHHVESPRPDLLTTLAAVCLRQVKDAQVSVAVIHSSVLTLRLARDDYDHDGEAPTDELRKTFEHLPAPVRKMAFWANDDFCQNLHPQDDPWNRLFATSHYGPIRLNREQDAGWMLESLSDPKRLVAERAVMLEAAMRDLWDGKSEWGEYMLKLKEHVADCPDLIAVIDEKLKPAPVNHELVRMEADHQKYTEQARLRQAKEHASWVSFWREVVHNPDTAFSSDRLGITARKLWQAMSRSGNESRSSGWNRRFIEQHFGKEIADRLRMAMASIWRNDRPTLRTERPDGEKDTFLIRWKLGLAAVAAEAEDADWALKLSFQEAELAARYAPLELSGFPSWLESLAIVHPAAVEAVLGPELTSELEMLATPNSYRIFLQNISYATPSVAALFLSRIKAWFDANHQHVREGEDAAMVGERLRRVIDILLKHEEDEAREHIEAVAMQQLAHGIDSVLSQVWLPVLMRLNPVLGTERLGQSLRDVDPSATGPGVEWIGLLFGDRHHHSLVDLRVPEFTPPLLLKLVRLAYRHVRPSDDFPHEGVFTPGLRDHAEQGRNALLSALLDAKGQEGWSAKLEMANDPLFTHFRDRALLISREKAAEEVDAAELSESQVVALDRYRESPPVTREEMFELLVDRLDDINDLLLRDDSPRAAWAAIADEKVMRREIARELRNASNHIYTVDQEGVTADEKETDIRLRAATSEQQAVIELKLGDKRSGRDLRDTVKDQLVTKYMAPHACRSGCLLVTINHSRKWDHPDTGESLDVVGLETMLQTEAEKITNEMRGLLRLTARVLDLRPRLSTEKVVMATR